MLTAQETARPFADMKGYATREMAMKKLETAVRRTCSEADADEILRNAFVVSLASGRFVPVAHARGDNFAKINHLLFVSEQIGVMN